MSTTTIVTNLLTADLVLDALAPILTPNVEGAFVELIEQVRPDDYVTSRFAPNDYVAAFEIVETLLGLSLVIQFDNGSRVEFAKLELLTLEGDEGAAYLVIVANGAAYHISLGVPA